MVPLAVMKNETSGMSSPNRLIPTLLIFLIGIISIAAQTENEKSTTQSLAANSSNFQNITSEYRVLNNETRRKGRTFQVKIIDLSNPRKKTKRQIIKIPGDVSKVRVIRQPVTVRHFKPSKFPRFSPNFKSISRRPNNRKPQLNEYESDSDENYTYDSDEVKRNLKKTKVKGMTLQELYEDDELEFLQGNGGQRIKKSNYGQVDKTKTKISKHVLNDYLSNYESVGLQEGSNRASVGAQESVKNRYKDYGGQTFNGYDSASSSLHMKQVPAPNLFSLKVVKPSELTKHYAATGKFQEDNYIPGLTIKKLPLKGRQMQSIFTQQYTTHNPHVTTNFGINGYGDFNSFSYVPKTTLVDATPYAFPATSGKFSQPAPSASDQVVAALPTLTPGIQVIQPPQFRDVTVGHPSNPSRLISSSHQQQEETTSQRATIRDILAQDCPFHEYKGYCDSPPRYPMQQISNIIKKCASLMDMMNTQPFEGQHDSYHLTKRADNLESDNTTKAESRSDNPSAWSRSNEGPTACQSDLTITEPGYAKEIISGRWFVVVQHPDTTVQRIATDTCKNPGKPCGGLSDLKCNKINGLSNKSTKCIQRYTHQRLISWDPESPEGCPRIRLFRFPSACVCHLMV